MKIITTIFLLIFFNYTTFAQQSSYEQLFSTLEVAQIKEDIDFWMDWVHQTHPDLSYTIKDIDKFYNDVNLLKNSINEPISVLEFWKKISPLNTQLSDGHLIVGHISSKILKDYIAGGKELFPFNIVFDEHKVIINTFLNGSITDYHGYSIKRINNIPIDTITKQLLLRVNGDSYIHRKVILQNKFSLYHMLYYGESEEYDISISLGSDERLISIKGKSELPEFYQSPRFSENFNFEILDKKNALLTINEFWWHDKKEFYDYMELVFTSLKDKNIEHLIIDIRENGGGDDEFWIEGILKYIAAKPYRWGSKYKKKIIDKYRDPGEVIGTVKIGEIDTIISPDLSHPLRFTHKVSVIIGPYTYSSSILFANTVQDYNFAELVGEPTGGKSGQTGGIQFSSMPHSKLNMVAPRFYLERPKGGKNAVSLDPDIPVHYSKLRPEEIFKKIIVFN